MECTITHKGKSVRVDVDKHQAELEKLINELGPWVPGESNIEMHVDVPKARTTDFDSPVMDETGRARAQKQQDAINAAGGDAGRHRQYFDTGMTLLDIGVTAMNRRRGDHDALPKVKEQCEVLKETHAAEKRVDRVVTANEFARGLSMNGGLTFEGLHVGETAIKSSMQRIGSRSAYFVLAVRDRIASGIAFNRNERARAARDPNYIMRQARMYSDAMLRQDKDIILSTLQKELDRFGKKELMLRTREGITTPDIYGVVSPSYGVADFSDMLPHVLGVLPGDVRGIVEYDQETTAWKVRGEIFTPTPADEMVVGEAFRAFASVWSKDDGMGALNWGGLVELIRCLNATTYQTGLNKGRRVHRQNILQGISVALSDVTKALHVMANAWGTAREDVISLPQKDGATMDVAEAIPGLFLHMLTARKGELVGVLPGAAKDNAKNLAHFYFEERRNETEVTRADLGNGFSRYLQEQSMPVQSKGEAALGKWIVNQRKVEFAS